MQIGVQQYYAVAAASPEVALKVGALARERIGGLQGVAAEAPKPRAYVLGHRWDAACSELRRFLDRNQVTFEWITPDASDAAESWGGDLPPESDCPALRTGDGTTLARPQLRERRGAARAADAPRLRASTTRSSSAPGRPVSPPPCTGRPRACARS